MWFAKWFGGRNELEDTDEPARHVAPPTRTTHTSSTTIVRQKKKPGSPSGFDPYNSGAFERRNAWEKVSKR